MPSSLAPSPPRAKAVFADFAGPSRGVRLSSNRRNKPMQRNSSPHSSPAHGGDCSSGGSRPTLSLKAHLVGSHPRSSNPGSNTPTRSQVFNPPSQKAFGRSLCASPHFGSTPIPTGTTFSPPRAIDKSLPGSHQSVPTTTLTGTSTSSPLTLMHFSDYVSSASCQLQDTDIGDPIPIWKFCLIGYVTRKFPGYAALLNFIRKNWKHKSNFTMHDSGWLIFAFHSELEMLDILSSGPYFIFGRPLILKVMPEFFDFQPFDMARMPTWVRFPNLPLCCWTPICLSKIAIMVGKPIHCDVPTANMTRLLYARILIEIDLLQDLPAAVNVILPNGTPFSQQITYESFPCFCMKCRVIGHSINACKRGPKK